MASTGACLFPGAPSPSLRRQVTSSVRRFKSDRMRNMNRRLAASVSVEQATSSTARRTSEKREEAEGTKLEKAVAEGGNEWEEVEQDKRGWKAYFEESKELIKSDGGPPRWFSPLDGGSRFDNSPLLLFLPGQYFYYGSTDHRYSTFSTFCFSIKHFQLIILIIF